MRRGAGDSEGLNAVRDIVGGDQTAGDRAIAPVDRGDVVSGLSQQIRRAQRSDGTGDDAAFDDRLERGGVDGERRVADVGEHGLRGRRATDIVHGHGHRIVDLRTFVLVLGNDVEGGSQSARLHDGCRGTRFITPVDRRRKVTQRSLGIAVGEGGHRVDHGLRDHGRDGSPATPDCATRSVGSARLPPFPAYWTTP